MASAKMTEALAQVEAENKPSELGFASIFSNIRSLSTPKTATEDLKAILDAVFGASFGIVTTRTVLAGFLDMMRGLKNNDLWIAVGAHALELLGSSPQSASSYIDRAMELREMMATAHEQNEDFLEAAKVLADMPLDASQRHVSAEEKVRVWVRIVRDYLEVGDSTSAEAYLNKLKNVIYTVTDPELNLHFRLSQARILDANRIFLDASPLYHSISHSPAIAEEERLHTLGMAIKCAILAPAGPSRSRVLARLYMDERAAGLDEFSMLEKMFLDRLIAPREVDRFAQDLQPHQLARTADGSTVLTKAVVEHNLLAASRLYANIALDALGVLLGLDGDKAEETTARMIEQGRLVGRIDQIDRLIWFEGGEASGHKGSGRAEVVVGKELKRWDVSVRGLTEEVQNVTNALQREFPDFVAANLAV